MTTLTQVLLALLALETVVLVAVSILYRRAKKASRTRRVEAPNSQYKSPYVMDLEAKDRWETMDLDRLHELNREEVEKLLGKVRALGVRGLTEGERAFLDRMADSLGQARRSGRRGGRTTGTQLPRTS